ncbi:hypothetical protein CR513_15186, partial [Mucuna pruriens]
MKHPTKDHSLFSIDIIDELVEEYMQIGIGSADFSNFVEIPDVIDYFNFVEDVSDSVNMPHIQDISDSEDNIADLDDLVHIFEFSDLTDLPLPDHLKYAYLDDHHQLLVVIPNNLNREQEEKLLNVLRKHKKAIGWTLADLPRINPSICMHKILLEEEARPIRQLNPTILEVVKKEVTRLLATEIIYPISNSQWVCLVQVVP